MIESDVDLLVDMSLEELWDNYMEAMNAAIVATKMNHKEEAIFYIAVVRVTLDIYFEQVEASPWPAL